MSAPGAAMILGAVVSSKPPSKARAPKNAIARQLKVCNDLGLQPPGKAA